MATACQAGSAIFSDEHAAEGLIITNELRALFECPAAASAAVPAAMQQAAELLSIVPPELLSIILSQLGTRDLACLAATCRSLSWGVQNPPSLLLTPGAVETELRRRAEARGLLIGLSLPDGALSWVSCLLRRDFHDALRRETPLTAGWNTHSLFVDREGRLHLACRRGEIQAGTVGEPLVGNAWGSGAGAAVSVPPMLVPSMQDKRIVSVATSEYHCLALSAEGEIYSSGDGSGGALGHADGGAEAGPRGIATLTHIKKIAARPITSAAVDDRGRRFTWGRAAFGARPAGLGYALDPETACQLTPKRVDMLSECRVIGVALSGSFTLAVTDAGAVFFFGYSPDGGLGHGFPTSEVLPRRIHALAVTGQRFVAVAAGECHSLALTEEGHVYAWGYGHANGHGQDQSTPQLVAALAGQRVKLVYAVGLSSCAVTEKGELYTWGHSGFSLGHGVDALQMTPKRLEALRRVKVATAAICASHTLAADTGGVVWAFGYRAVLGLGDADAPVVQPTQIPSLRVRVP